ncbi:MAG: hypothetical protein IJH95_07270 [Mogibacterium sp.]|nr:hypothetical protein [Mogibacterium sp.]
MIDTCLPGQEDSEVNINECAGDGDKSGMPEDRNAVNAVNDGNDGNDVNDGNDLKTALIYMIISIVLVVGGAVYEHFSFGVYSNYMIYAFAVPLIGGTLPYMLSAMRYRVSKTASDDAAARTEQAPVKLIGKVIRHWMYHAAIATLTVGSIMQGILAICGRPNSLVIVYPIAAVILIAASAALSIRQPGHKYVKSSASRDCSQYKH